jgi:hypothetical protein
VNLIFAVTAGAAHAHTSALAMDLKFAGAFFTLHGISLKAPPG